MPKIDPEACPERVGSRYPPPHDAACQTRRWRQIALGAGLADFGANLVTLVPGAWSSQRHWHDEVDELMVMLAGELVLIEDEGRTTMRPGDIAVFPKGSGNGHHLVNEGGAEARFLVVGASGGDCFYPDIDLKADGATGAYQHRDGTPY